MEIFDYCTSGGKNVIVEYIEALSKNERLEIYDIRDEIRKSGLDAFEKINTRQLRGKLWEIKASQTRIMYVIVDMDRVVFLHICKKEKGKTEKKELERAIRRGKEEGVL